MNRREYCKLTLGSAAALLANSPGILVFSQQVRSKGTGEFSHIVPGNYRLTARVYAGSAVVTFSGQTKWPIEAQLEISEGKIQIVRVAEGERIVLKDGSGPGASPWDIKVLKQGNFFRYQVNSATGWIREPLAAWASNDPVKYCEPSPSNVGISVTTGEVTSWDVEELTWLPYPASPAMEPGPDGTFRENQLLVGGVVQHAGKYYMYFTGDRFGCEEGAGVREIGVAHSVDLEHWTIEPEPVLRVGAADSWEPTGIYSNGATITPDGRIAVMYSAQSFPKWNGFGVAFADNPLGPFEKSANNPVYKHPAAAHEFDLVQTEDPKRRYILFYAGFTPAPSRGPVGDRGYILYSNDLIHWRAHENNPVFHPETIDDWDAIHVRPRSLTKIEEWWYLWYEGSNQWQPPASLRANGVETPTWWDTVGLARSRDLVNWEYYSNNPALPGTGISKTRFDNSWVGWPRMVVKDGVGFVFYTGGRAIGLRKIRLTELMKWNRTSRYPDAF